MPKKPSRIAQARAFLNLGKNAEVPRAWVAAIVDGQQDVCRWPADLQDQVLARSIADRGHLARIAAFLRQCGPTEGAS